MFVKKSYVAIILFAILLLFTGCGENSSSAENIPTVAHKDNIMQKGTDEAEMIKNSINTLSWAYYLDKGNERWYISPVSSSEKMSVYSLMGFQNGRGGWATVGEKVALFNLNSETIKIDYIQDNYEYKYYDIGWQSWTENSIIQSDIEKIRNSTVNIKWWFFQASNGLWYIVNKDGIVLKFSSKIDSNGNRTYDWINIDMGEDKPVFFVENGVKKVRFTSNIHTTPSLSLGSVVTHIISSKDEDDPDYNNNKIKSYSFTLNETKKIYFKVRYKGKDNNEALSLFNNNEYIYSNMHYDWYQIPDGSTPEPAKDTIITFSKELNSGTYTIKISAKIGAEFNLYTSIINKEHQIANIAFQTQIGACKNSCGFASSAMLYAYHTHTQPSISLINTLISKAGVTCGSTSSPDKYLLGLKNYGIKNIYSEFTTYDAIKAYISNNIPIQVSIWYGDLNYNDRAKSGKNYLEGHAVVIVGYSETKNTWYIYDPLETTGFYKEIPSSDFRNSLKIWSPQETHPHILLIKS